MNTKTDDSTERSERNETMTMQRIAEPRASADAPHIPERRPTTTLLTRHEGGYAAQGPGFYVWDRDAGEVIRIAEALQAGRLVGSRSARFLMIDEPDGR